MPSPISLLRCQALLTVAFIVASLGIAAGRCQAQSPASLQLVPADAAFYSAATRLREQYDIVVGSRAIAKLRELPIVQMGLAMAAVQWSDPDGDLATIRELLAQPENQQLADVLIDAASHEVFIYGSAEFENLLDVLSELNRTDPPVGSAQDAEAVRAALQQMVRTLSQRLETTQLPDTVIGCRLSNTQPALTQLARLKQVLEAAFRDRPEWKSRLSHSQVAGGEFLTLELDGSLIPWESLTEKVEIDLSELQKQLTAKKLFVSVGVQGSYLIVSAGDSLKHLETMGQGSVLGDRQELAALKKHAQRRITSVAYVSDGLMRRASFMGQRLDQLATFSGQYLAQSGLPAELQQEIRSDVSALASDIKHAIPQGGAASAFSFLTERGYEGYTYSWGENKKLDGSQPLTILNHLGGDPLMFAAGRQKYAPETYTKIAKWLGRGIYYGETIGLEQLGPEDREFYQRLRRDLAPLITKCDQVTRDKLIPAFRDGQAALVVDAKTSSVQWHERMPAADQPLPILECALVYGVSDPNLLREAAGDYFRIGQQILDVLHAAEPARIPEIVLPAPESREVPGGQTYYYLLPAQLGLDKQISPNAGLSNNILVFSVIPKLTVRLLSATPLVAAGPLAEHRGDEVAAAFKCSVAGLIDAVTPWIDYGIRVSGDNVEEDVREQIRVGLTVAKCLRGVSAVTYLEGDAWVTHYETELQDVP